MADWVSRDGFARSVLRAAALLIGVAGAAAFAIVLGAIFAHE